MLFRNVISVSSVIYLCFCMQSILKYFLIMEFHLLKYFTRQKE